MQFEEPPGLEGMGDDTNLLWIFTRGFSEEQDAEQQVLERISGFLFEQYVFFVVVTVQSREYALC